MSREQHNERFLEWVDSYDAILWKIARAYAPSGEQDALHQDLLIALWHAAPLYRDQAKPSTFIYRVALNSALNWTRTRTRHQRRHVELDENATQLAAPSSVANEQEQRIAELYAALTTLPEADRSLALLYLDNFSYQEIAAVLGITESNVGVKLNRLKKRLAEKLSKEKT